MATAPTESGAMGAQGENTGRWTAEEHRLFLQGLELHGKGWKKIAGLIKSRTVVQIRTHAQKYFQKLAKAKQNGEEGEILMEGRGGTPSIPSVATSAAQNNKRRKQTSGTKRKAIQSVVASAQREAKKLMAIDDGAFAGITSVAPALSPYILPPVANPMDPSSSGQQSNIPSVTTAHGTISGSALEESLYVDFLIIISFFLRYLNIQNLTGLRFSPLLLSYLQFPLPDTCPCCTTTRTTSQQDCTSGRCQSYHCSC